MTTESNRLWKISAVAALLISGLSFGVSQPASAHKLTAHPVAYNTYHYRYGGYDLYPRWLRNHHDFRGWHRASQYRYLRRPDWRLLYDIYLHDRSTHRLRQHKQRRWVERESKTRRKSRR